MATVRTNPMINGLSGMLGQSVVFKNYNGRTIVTNRPKQPKKQSEIQKNNRSKFRMASEWAQGILLDPEKRTYYQKKAKKLKLPNAYTAAVTDYMRKPVIAVTNKNNKGNVIVMVSKKDFRLKKVEVYKKTPVPELIRNVIADDYGDYIVTLSAEEIAAGIYFSIENEAGNTDFIEKRL